MSNKLNHSFEALQAQIAALEGSPEVAEVPAVEAAPEAPEAAIEPQEAPAEAELSDIEQQARSLGWRPKSEFKDDPADFVEAAEFVSRAPLYNQIHKLKKQNERLEQGLNELMKNYRVAEQRGRENMKAEILAAKQNAYLTGDIDQAQQLEQQHEQMLREDLQRPAEPLPQTVTVDQVKSHSAWQQFAAENPWITGTDERSKLMQQKAQELANEFADAIGPKYSIDHIPRHIEYIKTNMGLKTPEKRPSAPAVMGAKPKSSGTSGGRNPDYNRMTPVQKDLARQLCHGPNATMSLDEYIKSLELNGSLLPKE